MKAVDWVLPCVLLAMAVLVPRYGADSRGAVPVRTHTITGDLRGVLRAVQRFYGDQVYAWEVFWRLQHPWESEPLTWTRVKGEWRLTGRVLPAGTAESGEGSP